MDINVNMTGVSGAFNTDTGKLVCVHYEKYNDALLCFKESSNITFAVIKLFDSGLLVDAKATYSDACKLGDEIVRRWNENETLQNIKAELQKAINERNEAWFQLKEAGIEIDAKESAADEQSPSSSKHGYKWGEDYHYSTFFHHEILDPLIDDLIKERCISAQEAIEFISQNRTCTTNHTREYWSGKYLFNGIVYAGYIEDKIDED